MIWVVECSHGDRWKPVYDARGEAFAVFRTRQGAREEAKFLNETANGFDPVERYRVRPYSRTISSK